ncbi:MAG TPA: SusD/RagB family nutrient-binding outer membrane lipoprotein, partial [Flavobacterium sp.]|nr:SusD/RagB family nutrient-binding outer membrane lipoprotein [Flavobacterium sp.]
RALIANAPSSAEEAVSDVMLGGDMDKWVSFANTIELRLLLRQSNLTDGETVTYRNQKLAQLAALNNFVTADVTINPGYSEANDDQQNPFFNDFVADAAGTAPQNRNFVVASAHIASFLNGTQTAPYNTVGLVDPRRFRMFTNPAPGGTPSNNVGGVVQGDVTIAAGGNAPTDTNLSRLGIGVTGLVNGSANGGNTSLQNGSRRNGFVMLAAESYFLQSEAAVRYPGIFTQDAKSLFEQGITASFAFYSPTYAGATLPALDAAAYIAAADSYPGIGWTASSNKIQAIMTQKWLALTSIHGIEPYIEFIRTGYPVTPQPLTANGPTKPKRLFYPLSEYVANSGNVPQLSLPQIFTQGAFWISN